MRKIIIFLFGVIIIFFGGCSTDEIDFNQKIEFLNQNAVLKSELSMIGISSSTIDFNKEYFVIETKKSKEKIEWVRVSTLRGYPAIEGWIQNTAIEKIDIPRLSIIELDIVKSIYKLYLYNEPSVKSKVSGGTSAGQDFFVFDKKTIINDDNQEEEWIKVCRARGRLFPPVNYNWVNMKDFKYIGRTHIIDPETDRDPSKVYLDLDKFSEGLIDTSKIPTMETRPMGFGNEDFYAIEGASIVYYSFLKSLLVFNINKTSEYLFVKAESPDGRKYEAELIRDQSFWFETILDRNYKDYNDNDVPIYKIMFENFAFFDEGIWKIKIITDEQTEYRYNLKIYPSSFSISSEKSPNPLLELLKFSGQKTKEFSNKQSLNIWGRCQPEIKYLISLHYKPEESYSLFPRSAAIVNSDNQGRYSTEFSLFSLESGEYYPVTGEEELKILIRDRFTVSGD